MVSDPSVSLKPESLINSGIVSVSFLVVGEARCQVCRHKANGGVGVVESDGNCPLVASHARHAGLLDTALHIFDVAEHRGLHKDAQRSADKLPTSQEDILFVPVLAVVSVQGPLDGLLPHLLSRGVAVHDLLRVELDYLLEPDGDDLWLDRPQFRGPEPGRQIVGDAIGSSVEIERPHETVETVSACPG